LAKFTPKQYAKVLQKRIRRVEQLVLTAMDQTVVLTKKQLITKHLNEKRTKPTAVRKQSGRLQKSIVTTKASRGRGLTAVATFSITSKYAGVHIGKRGARTRITGRRGKLAIPTKFARRASGEPSGVGPRDPRFNIKYVAKSRKGNTIMFGTASGSKNVVPLFTLVKSVVVPTRVDTQKDIVRPAEATYKRLVRQGLRKALR
jgi:hypothetical protein